MYVRLLALAMATAVSAPAGSSAAPGPQPRKTTRTSSHAETTAVSPGKGKGRVPRHLRALRKGKVPDAGARIERKTVDDPSRRLVSVERARKPLRMRSLAKPAKISFPPCSASLPPQAPRDAQPTPGMDAAVFERQYRWPAGATLKIGFLDGHRAAREAVAHVAREWTDHANLELQFWLDAPPQEADILISFDATGCSSAVGTSSRYYTETGQASMRLCHKDQLIGPVFDPSVIPDEMKRVVLHELGHALGLHHEHQNPRASIDWNEQAVYEYYAIYNGWDRQQVDFNLFRQIAPHAVDTSQYDPDSVMHYFFPPQFTTNGVSYGGSRQLSALDKEHIAKFYPRDTDVKVRRRFERKIAVRNDTASALDVQLVHERRSSGKSSWKPSTKPLAAPSVRIAAGAERTFEGQGQRVKLVARTPDGSASWSEWASEPLRISPAGGYLDVEMQTYVVVIDGPPDPVGPSTPGELYAAAARAQETGDQESARGLFGELVERFPADPLVPWARFNVVVSWYEQKRWEEALQRSYDLIVAHPAADATIFAWYYGGISSLQLGWCDGVRSYLGYVQEETSGAPEDWRASASEYLAAIDRDPGRWCW